MDNGLILWGDAPRWQYSTAPLMTSSGQPVKMPSPGSGGTALRLDDQQASLVLLLTPHAALHKSALDCAGTLRDFVMKNDEIV